MFDALYKFGIWIVGLIQQILLSGLPPARLLSLWRFVTSSYTRVASLFAATQASGVVELNFLERRILLPILRLCVIPDHIAFIMDGNRRFARWRKETTVVGHKMGFDRLRRLLPWCFELGMKEVSVYAFSVDNFSRSEEEVDYLMNLAETKLGALCEDDGFVMQHRIKVRICGDISLLRPTLQHVIRHVHEKTGSHECGTFNILLAYSSKREISQAVERSLLQTSPKDITWEHIERNLYLQTPPDLLVRTSGETRLSDFLIWQISADKSVVVFDKHFWPDYSVWAFIGSLLRYNYYTAPAHSSVIR